jgi:hypothetical protein
MRCKAAMPGLKDREVTQQRQDADYDHDDAHDLFGAAVDRQHVDEIEDEDDDKKGDQDADEDRHENPRVEIIERTFPIELISLFLGPHNRFCGKGRGIAADNAVSVL